MIRILQLVVSILANILSEALCIILCNVFEFSPSWACKTHYIKLTKHVACFNHGHVDHISFTTKHEDDFNNLLNLIDVDVILIPVHKRKHSFVRSFRYTLIDKEGREHHVTLGVSTFDKIFIDFHVTLGAHRSQSYEGFIGQPPVVEIHVDEIHEELCNLDNLGITLNSLHRVLKQDDEKKIAIKSAKNV